MSWLKSKKAIKVYTDGSCLKNPGGAGGWAAIVCRDGEQLEFSGAVACTTNNRMELLACIMALATLPEGSHVFLHTDSQYVRNGIVSGVPKWRKNGWLNELGKEVANKDLWELLEMQNRRHVVSWLWVKGHQDDNELNTRCDELAYAAAHGN